VTGAVIVFSTLPGDRACFSFAFASGVVTNTKRAGEELALVGAHFSRS
jgi:hypothetical protein